MALKKRATVVGTSYQESLESDDEPVAVKFKRKGAIRAKVADSSESEFEASADEHEPEDDDDSFTVFEGDDDEKEDKEDGFEDEEVEDVIEVRDCSPLAHEYTSTNRKCPKRLVRNARYTRRERERLATIKSKLTRLCALSQSCVRSSKTLLARSPKNSLRSPSSSMVGPSKSGRCARW